MVLHLMVPSCFHQPWTMVYDGKTPATTGHYFGRRMKQLKAEDYASGKRTTESKDSCLPISKKKLGYIKF